jgi:hypothetical protein
MPPIPQALSLFGALISTAMTAYYMLKILHNPNIHPKPNTIYNQFLIALAWLTFVVGIHKRKVSIIGP